MTSVPGEAGELHLLHRDRGAGEGLQGRARSVRVDESARDEEVPIAVLVHPHLEVLRAPEVLHGFLMNTFALVNTWMVVLMGVLMLFWFRCSAW